MAEVEHNRTSQRFEMVEEGRRAGYLDYVPKAGRMLFTHTKIDDAFSGRGLGGELIGRALDHARDQGMKVVPLCPFVSSYIAQHRDYTELVDADALEMLNTPPRPRT